MRFGKRSKNSLFWGKQSKSASDDAEFSPVASEERSALLNGEEKPAAMHEEPVPADSGLGDPTQRLLTALGRFQRHKARAQDGLPQEAWSDECMKQLINAVEIAMTQGWTDVVNTLTDTARILQSYEDVGKASQCVPFLGDSYDILCWMIGDLIVGQVRPGAIEKWRQRYERAIEELRMAGIPLVQDEDEEEAPENPAPADVQTQQTVTEIPITPPAPLLEPRIEKEAFSHTGTPTIWENGEPVEMDEGDIEEEAYSLLLDVPSEEPEEIVEPEEFPETLLKAPAFHDIAETVQPEPSPPVETEEEAIPAEPEEAEASLFDQPYAGETGALEELETHVPAAFEPETPAEETYDELPTALEPVEEYEEIEEQKEEQETGVTLETAGYDELDLAVEEIIQGLGHSALGLLDEPEEIAPEQPLASDEPPVETPLFKEFAKTDALSDAEDSEQVEKEEESVYASSVTGRHDLPQEVRAALDNLCDSISRLSADEYGDVRVAVDEIGSVLVTLEQFAKEHGREGAVLPCLAMGRLVRLIGERQAVPDERFFELSYAFCSLFGEAGSTSNDPSVQRWLAECDDLLVSWALSSQRNRGRIPAETKEPLRHVVETPYKPSSMAKPPSEALSHLEPLAPLAEEKPVSAEPKPAEAPAPEEPQAEAAVSSTEPAISDIHSGASGVAPRIIASREPRTRMSASTTYTTQNLLETAQKAIQQGNTTNAKLLAMQAAAQIALAQAKEAEGIVQQAEQRLKEGVEKSEQATLHVHRIEQQVAESESAVAEAETGLIRSIATAKEGMAELEHVDALIKEIDNQIRSLEAQREDALLRKKNTSAALGQMQAAEARAKQELERYKSSEMQARVALEDARQNATALARKRAENAATMEKAREYLLRQRDSLADIEETIAQICASEAANEENQGNLLF